MMQALVLDQPGSPATLRLAEVPRPVPGPGEVLVRVHAVGLNPVDYQLAQSGHAAWQYPFILGLDVSGTIEELGEGVTQWRPGEPVYYHGDLSRPGGYAQWAVAAAHVVKPMLHEVIALDEIPTALVRLSGRHVRGKIVAAMRDRLAEALGALDLPLSEADLVQIERAVPPGAAAGERYHPSQMAALDSERRPAT